MAKDFIVRFSNSEKQPYNQLTIPLNYINDTLCLTFVGEGYTNYNGIHQQNTLNLLERFADSTPPTKATQGQLWYDNATNELKVANIVQPYFAGEPPSETNPLGVPAQEEVLGWFTAGAPIVGESEPLDTNVLWYKQSEGELYAFDSFSFKKVGQSILPLVGGTITGALTVQGTLTFTSATASNTSGTITSTGSTTFNNPLLFQDDVNVTSGGNSIVSTNATNLLALTDTVNHITVEVDNANASSSKAIKIRYGVTTPVELVRLSETEILVGSALTEINTNGNRISDLGAPTVGSTSKDAARYVDLTTIQTTSISNLLIQAGDTMTGDLIVPNSITTITTKTGALSSSTGSMGLLFDEHTGSKKAHIRTSNVGSQRLFVMNEQCRDSNEDPPQDTQLSVKLDVSENKFICLQPGGGARVLNVATGVDDYDAVNLQQAQNKRTDLVNAITAYAATVYGPKAWIEVTGGTYRGYNAQLTVLGTGQYRIDLNTSSLFAAPSSTNKVGVVVGSLMADTSNTSYLGTTGNPMAPQFGVINSVVKYINPTRVEVSIAKMSMQTSGGGFDDCVSWHYFTSAAFSKDVNILIYWE